MIYPKSWAKGRLCYLALLLNTLARVNEQQVMTDIRGRIGTGLRTPFRMRKQEIAGLTHDPDYLE